MPAPLPGRVGLYSLRIKGVSCSLYYYTSSLFPACSFVVIKVLFKNPVIYGQMLTVTPTEVDVTLLSVSFPQSFPQHGGRSKMARSIFPLVQCCTQNILSVYKVRRCRPSHGRLSVTPSMGRRYRGAAAAPLYVLEVPPSERQLCTQPKRCHHSVITRSVIL